MWKGIPDRFAYIEKVPRNIFQWYLQLTPANIDVTGYLVRRESIL